MSKATKFSGSYKTNEAHFRSHYEPNMIETQI